MTQPGTLVLVVGPSGAGKDTLLDAARLALSGEARVHFARRVVTRSVQPDGEQHEPVDEAAFARRHAAGGFALSWEAHGLRYGIPATIEAELARGTTVVASVSRTVIAEAAVRHRVLVVEVTAPPAVLAARLHARGREDAAAVAARLARAVPLPSGVALVQVVNDRSVAEGAAALLAVLRRAGGQEG